MKSLLKKYNNMKYRYKLTNLLVVVSLVPMTVLALYSHSRMSSLVRKNEMEDMYSILEQTRENIDGQIEIYASLLNYLTYSPEIQEVIFNKDMDRYTAYEQYTEVVDPLLTVPKSYHEAILGIHLFAESIPVRHEYTLAPLSEVDGEWWSDKLNNTVTVQWIVDRDNRQIAAVREIYDGKIREAVLCILLDYGKVFQPLANIIERNSGGFVVDDQQNIVNKAREEADAIVEQAKADGATIVTGGERLLSETGGYFTGATVIDVDAAFEPKACLQATTEVFLATKAQAAAGVAAIGQAVHALAIADFVFGRDICNGDVSHTKKGHAGALGRGSSGASSSHEGKECSFHAV